MDLPINSQWLIVTVKQPVMYHQTHDEVWLLNPRRRYILNANRIGAIQQYIDTVSEFDAAALHSRLLAGKDITGSKILIERNRERGLGDLLFMTGPMGFLHHATGGNVNIDMMAYADRGMVLTHSPYLANGCVRCGPLEYDSIRGYNYQWFVNTVTEQDSEPDQLNVYDALFAQLGFDPADIQPQWKRPHAQLTAEDYQHLDMKFKMIWDERKIELRRIGYYVVAPFSNSTLRLMRYSRWLEIIKLLSMRRPVIVIGTSWLRLPDTDMSVGEFAQRVGSMGQGVINAIDSTSVRSMMAMISRSICLIGLDSAPLYVAQALNVPAVSMWGTHAPGSRIGYDKRYMDTAIWHQDDCRRSPCFSYNRFPHDKCPRGRDQLCCEVLDTVTSNDVLQKVDQIESSLNFNPEKKTT